MNLPILSKPALLSIIALLCLFQPETSVWAGSQGEAKVQTAYIYNFTKYTSWPQSPASPPLNICLLGPDPLAEQLIALEQKQVQSRKISVQFHALPTEISTCDVLFISHSQDDALAEILAGMDGRPILSISDLPSFAQRGGMIELIRQDNKIRFIINMKAVNRAGLNISSRLLKLATVINGEQSR